jgi:hypothetical protein
MLSTDCGSVSSVSGCITRYPEIRGVHGRSAATRPARAMEEKRDRSMMRTSGCWDEKRMVESDLTDRPYMFVFAFASTSV